MGNVFKKLFTLVLSILFVITGTISTTVYAEEDSSIEKDKISVSVTTIYYSYDNVHWTVLDEGSTIKNGTLLRFEGKYELSNIRNESATADKEFSFPLTPENVSIPDSTAKVTIANSNGSTFEIKEEKINFVITEEYVKTHGDISGGFSILGAVKIDDTKTSDKENVDIKIDGKTVTIVYDKNIAESSLDTNKEAVGNVYKGDDGNFYQDFKITMKSNNGDNTVSSLTDTMGSNLSLSGEITVRNDSTNTDLGTYSDFDLINSLVVPSNNTVSLTYTAKINTTSSNILGDVLSVENGYGNSFKATYKTNKDNEKETEDKTAVVKRQDPSFSKTGVKDGDSIVWTITINLGSYKDLSDKTFDQLITDLNDSLGEGMSSTSTLSKSDFVETSTGVYTATYTTKITADYSTGYTFKNTANFEFDGVNKEVKGEVVVGPTENMIEKTFVSYANKEFTWNIAVNFKSNMTEVVLTDSPNYMAPSIKYVAIGDDVIIEDGAVTTVGETIIDKSKWTTNQYTGVLAFKNDYVSANADTTKKITVKTVLASNETLSNNSEPIENTATLKYKVNGVDGSDSSTATYKYNTKVSKSASIDNNSDAIIYTVKVQLTAADDIVAGNTVTVKDTVDQAFKIDEKSISASYALGYSSYIGNVNAPKVTYDSATKTFSYTMAEDFVNVIKANPNNKYELVITYNAKPTDETDLYKDNQKQTIIVTNTAEGFINGNSVGVSSTETTYTAKDVLQKVGTYKNGNTTNTYGTFTVTINPNGAKLNNGNSLKAIDKMNKNLVYDLTTIKVVNTSTNKELTSKEYKVVFDDEENSLTFTLPDATPLQITYQATIVLPSGTKLNAQNAGNDFTLYGNSENAIEQKSYNLSEQYIPSVYIDGRHVELTILKYDSQDNSIMLKNATFKIYIASYNKNTKSWNISDTESTFNGKNVFTTDAQGKTIVSELLPDHVYAIKEVVAPDGYAFAQDVFVVFKGNSFDDLQLPDDGSVKVYNSQFATLNFADDELTAKGKLTLNKTFVNHEVSESDLQNITFTITGPDSYENTLTLNDLKNEDGTYSKTIEDLTVGEYTVVETISNSNNVVTKTYKVNDVESESGTVIVTSKKDGNIEITNTYSEAPTTTGNLTFTKTITGPVTEEDLRDISFTVTGPNNYSTTVSLSAMKQNDGSYSYTLSDLAIGEYTVTENNAAITGYNNTVSYKVNGTETQKITVSENSTSTMNITNAYTSKGALTLTKTFSGHTVNDEDLEKITFSITGPNEYSKTVKLNEFTLSEGTYTYSLDSLTYGTYTVTETNTNVSSNENVTVTYAVNGTASTSHEVSISKDNTSGTVAITNSYANKVGNLTFTKTIEGPVTEDDLKDISFTVTGPNNYNTTVSLSAMKQNDGSYSYTLSDLAIGEYTVTENNAAITGYNNTVSYKVNGTETQKITVSENSTSTMNITNAYTSKGALTLTKTFSGHTVNDEDLEKITFSITGPNEYSKTVKLNEFTLSEGTYTYSLDSLTYGTYTVTETNTNVSSNENVTVTYVVNGTTSTSHEVSISKDNTSGTVAVTNSYEKKLGSLTFTKIIDGLTTQEDLSDVSFTVTGPNNYSKTVYLKDMEKVVSCKYRYTIDDLEFGEYKIVENNADVKGYSVKTTFAGTNIYTVSAQSNAIIDITNEYSKDKKEEPKEEKPENKKDIYEYHIVTTSTH